MAKNKLYWEKEKKRGEKEGKKREKEKRIKEEKRKKENKRERKRKKGGKGWGKQSEMKKNMEYLLILYTLSPLTSPGTCPSSWSSGGGACCADCQVLALGGAALSPAWCRAQWG